MINCTENCTHSSGRKAGEPLFATFFNWRDLTMNKTKRFFSFCHRLVGIAAFAAVFLSASAHAAPKIVSVSSLTSSGTYTVGKPIVLVVTLDEEITSVSGAPTLGLDVNNTASGIATYDGDYDGANLYFTYTVQPGDFTEDLDCAENGFALNSATIVTGSGNLTRTGTTIPRGDAVGSLSQNADIEIVTITLDDKTLARSFEGPEGSTLSVEVHRGGPSSSEQRFLVTASEAGKVDYPSTFSIAKDAESATFEFTLLDATTAPVTLTLHPQSYGTTVTEGDIVLTITEITEGTKPTVTIAGPAQLEEGRGGDLTVSLPLAPRERTIVTLSSSDASKLVIGSTTLVWEVNETSVKSVPVQALDGTLADSSVTITAQPSSTSYGAGTHVIAVRNVAPTFINPEAENWEPIPGGEGVAYSVFWSGKDVDADQDSLRVVISWGDGTSTPYDGASGQASHTYNTAGTFGIIISLYDKDNGIATVGGLVEIEPAISVLINEYKVRLPDDIGQNTYKGLQGLGRGTVDDKDDNTTRREITAHIDYEIKFPPTQGAVTFVATPERFRLEARDATGAVTDIEYDSFFHVWVGEEDAFSSTTCLIPRRIASATIKLREGGAASSRQIGGVFAREKYPEDGCADIDADGLPDEWEAKYFTDLAEEGGYPFESVIGDFGEGGNIDGDFLPAGAVRNEAVVYPLHRGNGYYDYAPNGMAFKNVYEVRGFHHGLNMRTNQWSEVSLPIDEPHYGHFDDNLNFVDTDNNTFYGTDPTSPDTDGDSLLDGWEYYWWRVGCEAADGNLPNAVFERYDPTQVIAGTPLAPAEIIAAFHPLVPGDLKDDLDGDGLTNFEEMLLGTNPAHWDTDGDGMNDGWETMWGLDPLYGGDGSGNPDGDYMAAYGEDSDNILYRHAEVYKEFGFDPRTAWTWQYKERHHLVVGSDPYSFAPNTMPYSNYEEYYLGRWCIDRNIAFSVEPLSHNYFTQPVPNGTWTFYRYTPSRKEVNFARSASDSSASSDTGASSNGTAIATGTAGATSIIPPIGYAYQIEITTHGCDSDGDGMPDGWELYVCCGDNDYPFCAIWPISEDGSSALDAIGDPDMDGLGNIRECHSTDLCDYYSSIYSNFTASVNGNWYNKWWPTNPWNGDTDCDGLSDLAEACEGPIGACPQLRYAETRTVAQLEERYGANTMTRGHVPGGGLNPNSADTDMDYLPDFFEYQYGGFYRDTDWEGGFCDQPGYYSRWITPQTIKFYGGGMDGTYFDSRCAFDEFRGSGVTVEEAQAMTNKNFVVQEEHVLRDFDFDHDGLENYQEYLINGMYHLQYDKWQEGLDYGDYDIQAIFATGRFAEVKKLGVYWKRVPGGYVGLPMEPASKHIDWARFADNWQIGGGGPSIDPITDDPVCPFYYMPPEPRPFILAYASTDPRLADSDGDNMDDYYEMFHALNPILSEIVDLCGKMRPPDIYDFTKCPWLAGMANADPDQDGIPNWEEALSPNEPDPANHNTDPSPVWFTDISYPRSLVNLCYHFGSAANYWAPADQDLTDEKLEPDQNYPSVGLMWEGARPSYAFSFEMNEGFDTDNDNLSDRYEIFGTSGGVTDPQNSDLPIARKALYLDGDAAARTRGLCAFGKNALRSWTIEAWVCPENPASGKRQVILERPCIWSEGDTTPAYEYVRRTFRLGLEPNGSPFVEYNNGGKDFITECASAPEGAALEAGKWSHLAASFDGYKMKLKLYVDGRLVATKSTSAIPYTGFTVSGSASLNGNYSLPLFSPLVLGASDSNPSGHVDGGNLYINGDVYTLAGGQPALADFYKGWIDEVRVWTGVRPGSEDADDRVSKWGWRTIKEDRDALRSYRFSDVLDSRNTTIRDFGRMVSVRKWDVEAGKIDGETNNITWYLDGEGLTFDEYYQAASEYITMTGGENDRVRIPPMLLCCYNFDNLPDPDYESAVPAKFASLNGRPLDYAGAPWWRQANDRTTVYKGSADAPYCFQHYIENLVATLPLGYLHNVPGDIDYGYIDIMGPGTAEIPVYTYRPDHVANSKFWTRFTKAGMALTNIVENGENAADYENNFPNKANPYGHYYITSNYSLTEMHPTRVLRDSFDPVYVTMYNHLLPLRNARADLSVQLWDNVSGITLFDTDGDGLPDTWETTYGLDPNNADQNGNGVPDAFDDFDGDGLSNYAEWAAGTNPYDTTTSADGTFDYDASPFSTGPKLSYGFLYMDNDYVLDSYELQWEEPYASPFRYDEHEDRDFDGWDNWSEGLVGTRLEYSACNDVATTNAEGAVGEALSKAENFPLPELQITLDYLGGAIQAAKLVIHAYSHEDMNGWPDAVFVKDFAGVTLDTWPMTVSIGTNDLVYGHLRQGRNWFYAWMDKDGSALESVTLKAGENWLTWTDHEPAAIADNQLDGIDIGFDLNEVTFHLTDKAESFVRLSWQEAGLPEESTYVSITYNGNYVFNRMIEWPRTWIHEGDIISWNIAASGLTGTARKNFGLGALQSIAPSDDATRTFEVSLSPKSMYDVGISAAVDPYCYISNWVHSAGTLATPALYSPINREIVSSARPEFQFSLAPEFTEFRFRLVRRIDETGDWVAANQVTVFDERILAPGRFYNAQTGNRDLVVWKTPIALGDVWTNGVAFEQGRQYQWAINAYSPAEKGGTATAVAVFQAASASVPGTEYPIFSGKGVIDVDVSYPSAMVALGSGRPFIRVQAFRSKSFNGIPDASVKCLTEGSCRLMGLESGESYYIRAYIEQGGGAATRDKWESWGYYRADNASANPFEPVAVKAQGFGTAHEPYAIVIRDCDTDNDLLPDAYEWATWGNLSHGVSEVAAQVKKSLSFGKSPLAVLAEDAAFFTDADGDGLSDYDEFLSGSNPALADSDGDGISDALERVLGFDASMPETLKITSISLDADGSLAVDWTWEGVSAASSAGSSGRSGGEGAPAATLAREVSYEIQAKVRLDDAEWTTIRTVTTNLVDGEAVISDGEAPVDSDVSAFRFFRIKVGAN